MKYSPLLFALTVLGCSESRGNGSLDASSDGGPDSSSMPDTPAMSDAPTMSDAVTPDAVAAGPLVINEISAAGDEWVELYNAGAATLDLSEVGVTDTESDGGPHTMRAMRFPPGTTLAPGQYVLVLANQSDAGAGPQTRCVDGGPATCFHATWSLSASRGEVVWVLAPSGAVSASELYPMNAAPDGRTWGRLPNGAGPFAVNRPTPGATNAPPDAGPDAAPDVAVDASADVPLDAIDDAPRDVAIDARADVTPDAVPDGGPSGRELWILRVGEGTAALGNASTALFLERRSSADGARRGSDFALPTAVSGANRPVTLSGTATSEGALTRSVDGRFVTLAGYGAAPGMASIAGSMVERVVARVASDGAVDSSTGLGMAYLANNVRAAVTVDGSAFWTAGTGTTAGVQYKLRGATGEPVNVVSMPSNVRVVNIFGDQLYGSASVSAPAPGFYGVFRAGMGTPTTAGVAATLLPGFPTSSGPSSFGFAGVDRDATVAGVDTLYVADDRSTTMGGGVQRWALSAGGTWTLGATFNMGLTSGARGVTAWVDGGDVVVAAVTAENPSRVVVFLDRTGAPPGAAVVVATAPANTQYRGVALAPTP